MEKGDGGRQSATTAQTHDTFRRLWMEHVLWTRLFIISTAENLGDLDATTKRLMRNPSDFAGALRRYYDPAKANAFRQLLEDHLSIGGALVNAAKAKNTAEADRQSKLWHKNAEEIANFLASINPNWRAGVWRNMLFKHLQLTQEQAGRRLAGQYAQDIALFDEIQGQALLMADLMSQGIQRQFGG